MSRIRVWAAALVLLSGTVAMAETANLGDAARGAAAGVEAGADGAGRALPKVLYIVPWKRVPSAGIAPYPPRRQVDQPLVPLDPAAFRRELGMRRRPAPR